MRDRPRFALSIAARTALVAGLVGALLATGFSLWLRHTVYAGRYEATSERAMSQLTAMLMDAERKQVRPGSPGDRWFGAIDASYQTVGSNGQVLATADTLLPVVGSAPLTPVPAESTTWGPYRVKVRLGAYQPTGVCVPNPLKAPYRYCDQLRTLAGGEVEAWRMIQPANFYDPRLDDRPTISLTMVVWPFDAQRARADADKVLRPAMPLAVALIMLGACFRRPRRTTRSDGWL
jgi:hypothetical protein